MKAYEVPNLNIKSTDFANLFNVYVDTNRLTNNSLSYSINRTLFFKNLDLASTVLFDEYTIREDDEWTLISHSYYGTVDLWWLICKINNISNPSQKLETEKVIKLLKPAYVKNVLTSLKA